MIMDAVNQIRQFWTGKHFWWRHSWGFTISWLVFAFIAILIKRKAKEKKNALLFHIIIFILVDFASIFLSAGATYRIYIDIDKFG